MKQLFFAASLFLLHLGCSPETSTPVSSLDYMPRNSFAIMKINRLSSFKSDLKNNQIINAWNETTIYKNLAAKIAPLKYMEANGPVLLAFLEQANDSVDFILAAPSPPAVFSPDKATDRSIETITYRGREFTKFSIEGITLYSATIKNTLLLCSSLTVLHETVSSPSTPWEDPVLNSLYAAANPERSATVFFHLKTIGSALNSILPPATREKLVHFSDWVSLDIAGKQDDLSFNGVAIAQDSSSSYVGLFKNATPLAMTTPSFAPKTASSVISFAIGDFGRFSSNSRAYLSENAARDSIFQTVEEVGIIKDKAGNVVLLDTFGGDAIAEFLNSKTTGRINYQDHEIGILDETGFLSDSFKPLLKDFKATHYTILENAFLFSSSLGGLTNLLSHYGIEDTFFKTPVYKTARETLADESNILLVANEEGIEQLLEGTLSEGVLEALRNTDLSGYSISAQLVAASGFYHTTFLIKHPGAVNNSGTTTSLFTVKLDADLATDPQFVVNHRTNKKEIVVQDVDNNLYLISTEGKVLWKKPLEGRIQGNIMQVDLYKNGRLQLAFTTDNQFLIVDRNGKEVPPFTRSYAGGNLNPLAVFDYDNNRSYRFVVTQGSQVFMYNNQGAIVRGFTYTKTGSPIIGRPQHFRFGNRDYLVFRLENRTLKILNRVGQTRIAIDEKFEFSANEVYAYKNHFALTDTQGTLYMIDEKGKVSRTPFGLTPDHGMEATTNTLVYMNENVLTIKGHDVALDYGVYTAPRIFYIYDKIYVSVTDLQSHRTYLFDSNAEPMSGFPVVGNAPADLGDMDNDHHLELVTKSQENALVLYRLN